MYARQINSEESNAIREIGNALNQHKPDHSYKAKQKLLGIFALLTVVAEFTMSYFDLIDGGGAFIVMLPLGLYLLFTKEKVII